MSVVANGFFRIYGVSGDTEIRVSKAGYQTVVRRTMVAGHQTEAFELELTQSRPVVSGVYVMTFSAAPECASNLPVQYRTRTYTATLAPDGARIRTELSGARFPIGAIFGPGNQFTGSVEPNRVGFFLGSYHGDEPGGFYPPSLLEEIAAPVYLMMAGRVSAAPTATGYSGTLEGAIELLRVMGPWEFDVTAACHSTSHRFEISRSTPGGEPAGQI
jgi:hypothetical protein